MWRADQTRASEQGLSPNVDQRGHCHVLQMVRYGLSEQRQNQHCPSKVYFHEVVVHVNIPKKDI